MLDSSLGQAPPQTQQGDPRSISGTGEAWAQRVAKGLQSHPGRAPKTGLEMAAAPCLGGLS